MRWWAYLVGFTGSSVVVVATAKSSREKDQKQLVVCGTLAISRVWLLHQSRDSATLAAWGVYSLNDDYVMRKIVVYILFRMKIGQLEGRSSLEIMEFYNLQPEISLPTDLWVGNMTSQ